MINMAFKAATVSRAAVNITYTFNPLTPAKMAATASKRINVDDFMVAYGITAYCCSAYG